MVSAQTGLNSLYYLFSRQGLTPTPPPQPAECCDYDRPQCVTQQTSQCAALEAESRVRALLKPV